MDQLEKLFPAEAGRERVVKVTAVGRAAWPAVRKKLPPPARAWAEAQGFAGEAGRHVVLPDAEGRIASVLWGPTEAGKPTDPFAAGCLARLLPPGLYGLGEGFDAPELCALPGFTPIGTVSSPASESSTMRVFLVIGSAANTP